MAELQKAILVHVSDSLKIPILESSKEMGFEARSPQILGIETLVSRMTVSACVYVSGLLAYCH